MSTYTEAHKEYYEKQVKTRRTQKQPHTRYKCPLCNMSYPSLERFNNHGFKEVKMKVLGKGKGNIIHEKTISEEYIKRVKEICKELLTEYHPE